jgi:hypothetical protein
MTALARILALAAIIAALVLAPSPATASAGVGGALCSVAGLLSSVAGKVCTVASDPGRVLNAGKKLAGGHVGGAIDALTGSGASAVTRVGGIIAITVGVVAGAHYALKLTASAVGDVTNPDLGAVWFSASYWRMAAVAALLTVPFLFAAAIQAMLHADLSLLMRSAFGYLPLGLLAVGVAAPVTALLLAGSDEMSSIVSSASGHAGAGFLDRIAAAGGVISGVSGSAFVSFFIALFTIAAAATLWLELLIRQAAVYVIVLMLPLFFAAMVWPARRIWAVRAIELLVALILSKFAIVAVLGLGGAALGHTLLPGFGSLLAGTTLVLLAAFSPWAMLRLLPLHELAGAAADGLRPHGVQQLPVAGNRAEATTDATEDAAGAARGDEDAAAGKATSEEVAAGLPGRMRASMQRDGTDGAHAEPSAGDAGAGPEAASTRPAPGSGPEAASTRPAPGSGPEATSPLPAPGSGPDRAPAPLPETDAFGSTVRDGELPEEIRNMSPDADVLALNEPHAGGGDAMAEEHPPTLPPAAPESPDGPE